MNNRDWENLGNDILRTVQEAVESCNYDRLNQNISDAVSQVVGSVTSNVKNISASYSHNIKNKPVVFERKEPSSVGAVLMIVFGSIFGGLSFLSLFFTSLFAFLFGHNPLSSIWMMVVQLILMISFVCVIVGGCKKLGRIKRFRKYVKLIGKREYCNITELSEGIYKPEQIVVKDLEVMIQKQWFCQGHLDKERTCLMVTDQMYQQYRQLELQKTQYQQEEAQRERENKEREAYANAKLSPEVRKIIEQGDYFVKKIRECNDAIPGEEISAKIYHMEMIVDKIFDRVEENPASVSDIRRLMDYYLPTTIKLLEAYARMDAQPIGGENIQSAKKEIEATLDTLNEAFEKLLDSLFQEAAWDVSSDISVLNTMLAQEGLKNDGLKR